MSDAGDPVDVAFEESRRQLDSQESDLDGVRTRASFVLAAAGISAGTVLGGSGHSLTGFGLVAVIFYLAASGLATWVLIPLFNQWTFSNDPEKVLAEIDNAKKGEEEIKRWLIVWNHKHWRSNQNKMNMLYNRFFLAAIALVIAIGCTLLNLLLN
jgi:hypothetical protein